MWQIPLQEAVLEFDHDRLRQRISEVEVIIHARLQQLANADLDAKISPTEDHLERMALYDGLSILRRIERERLYCGEQS